MSAAIVSGELFLGINDFIIRDNAGAFTVTISQRGEIGRRVAGGVPRACERASS